VLLLLPLELLHLQLLLLQEPGASEPMSMVLEKCGIGATWQEARAAARGAEYQLLQLLKCCCSRRSTME
jgi:hypothetical protein